jgi:acyl carrier protein
VAQVQDIASDIRRLLAELSSIPMDTDENADLYRDLGMPSVKAMELLLRLEETFNVSVPDDSFVEATSIRKLTDMIAGLQA